MNAPAKPENSRARRAARRAAARAQGLGSSAPVTEAQRRELATFGHAPNAKMTWGQARTVLGKLRAAKARGPREPVQSALERLELADKPATTAQKDMLRAWQRRLGLRTALPPRLTRAQAAERIEALRT